LCGLSTGKNLVQPDMDVPLSALLSAAALIAASAFFSLSLSALSLARKSRFRLKKESAPADGAAAAHTGAEAAKAAEKPGVFVFGLRIWNLAVHVSAAAVITFSAAGTPGAGIPAVVPLLVLILAFVVFSEILPGLAAAAAPEGILRAVFPVLSVLSLPWRPLYLLVSAARRPRNEEEAGEEEFRLALEEGEKSGAVESRERSMVEGVLYLGDRPVSAFMTHRSETGCLDIGAGPEEAREKALAGRAQGFFPVVRGTQDDIAGVVSVEDLFIALTEPEWKGLPAVMKAPHFIPETMSALKAFEAFRREGEQYLCVMDEYGGFAGGLRVRNLLEEIVGELPGPASEEEAIVRQEDGSWLAGGSVSVDDLAGVLGLDIGKTGGNFHTLAGFILKLAGDIPRAGDTFTWDAWRFRVAALDGNRIGKVCISKSEAE
jgi:putative hemolysin